MKFLNEYYEDVIKSIQNLDKDKINSICELIKNTSDNRGTVYIAGNGGSASTASHISTDLTKNAKVKAMTFNDANLITCFSNDYGYENWVSEALNFYADKKDLVVCISSSGKSLNILNGAKKAKKMGCRVITFSGFNKNNPLRKLGHLNFWINSKSYNIVEMVHHIWLLSAVDNISKAKF